jgi:hypothetical protein
MCHCVREQSSPAVCLVLGSDVRFCIANQGEFDALGFTTSRVRVVQDDSLDDLREGRLRAPPRTRSSDVQFDCGQDFDSITGRWHFNCQASARIVRRDVFVAGWLVPQTVLETSRT